MRNSRIATKPSCHLLFYNQERKMIEMENQEHPDPDRWWKLKWQLCLQGRCFCRGCGVDRNWRHSFWKSGNSRGAVEPFVKIGVWGGLVPLAAYMGAAMVENIMGVWRK
jgi:hypothetical protein